MTPVDGFWGVKINLDDNFYNEKASEAYQKRSKKLMRMMIHINENQCGHSKTDIELENDKEQKEIEK